MSRWRLARTAAIPLMLGLSPIPVVGQSVPPGPACFEMFPAEPNTLPGSPMLLNKCTGQTYLLARMPSKGKSAQGGPYRWVPIGVSDGKEEKQAPTVAPAGRKCFTFDGRHFCQ